VCFFFFFNQLFILFRNTVNTMQCICISKINERSFYKSKNQKYLQNQFTPANQN